MSVSLEKILSISYLVPMGNPLMPECIWGLPIVLHGEPGIGKTDRVFQSGERVKLDVGVVELGGRQPEDAGGAPFLTKDDKLVIACLLGAVNELNEVGKGILFLDEFNWGRPATQGAFLSLVRNRRVGDTKLSNFIRILLAGNPPSSAGGGYALIPPMANRLAHFDISPPTDEEEDAYYMGQVVKNEEAIENGEKLIQDGWSDDYSKVVGLMMGFIRKFPDHKLKRPKTGDPQAHKAWPSPRSRENAARAVATCRILLKGDGGAEAAAETELYEDAFVEACIGKKGAEDWAAWRAEADIPDPMEMLENGYKPDKKRLDKTMAAYGAVTTFVLGRSTKEEREKLAAPMWRLLMTAINSDLSDMAYMISDKMINAKLGSVVGGEVAAACRPVMLRFGKKGFHEMANP